MVGILFLVGVLVTLGDASIWGGRRHGRIVEPINWEETGRALNLTFVEGTTSTIQVDFCQMTDCGDKVEASKLTWADKYVCYLAGTTGCTTWDSVMWTTAAQELGI